MPTTGNCQLENGSKRAFSCAWSGRRLVGDDGDTVAVLYTAVGTTLGKLNNVAIVNAPNDNNPSNNRTTVQVEVKVCWAAEHMQQ
jgi:hypothetical protein